MVAEMAQIPRKQAKTINLGMMYGMGVAKLADQLGIETDEAKDIIKQYHSRVLDDANFFHSGEKGRGLNF